MGAVLLRANRQPLLQILAPEVLAEIFHTFAGSQASGAAFCEYRRVDALAARLLHDSTGAVKAPAKVTSRPNLRGSFLLLAGACSARFRPRKVPKGAVAQPGRP